MQPHWPVAQRAAGTFLWKTPCARCGVSLLYETVDERAHEFDHYCRSCEKRRGNG